jgi:hypothetical protein
VIGARADELQFYPECPYCGVKKQPGLWAYQIENRDVVRCDGFTGCDRFYVVFHSIKVEKKLMAKVVGIDGFD